MTSAPRIINGDGHIMEDSAGITKFLPAPYIQKTNLRWFPPLDHFHAIIGETPPGSFRQVGVDGWIEFMEDVGLDKAVLYFFFSSRRRHTRWNCDWSSDVCSSD